MGALTGNLPPRQDLAGRPQACPRSPGRPDFATCQSCGLPPASPFPLSSCIVMAATLGPGLRGHQVWAFEHLHR